MEDIKERLRLVQNIYFSKHCEEKMERRKISKDFIVDNLRNPDKLTGATYEGDKYPGEKYELYFPISNKKSLKIVVNFMDKDLYVVTTHIISSKRLKLVEKWRKKHL